MFFRFFLFLFSIFGGFLGKIPWEIRYWFIVHFECLPCIFFPILHYAFSRKSKKCSFGFKLVRVWQQVVDHISKYIMIHWNLFSNHLTKLCTSVLNYRFLALIKLHTQSQLHLLIIDLTLNWSEHRASKTRHDTKQHNTIAVYSYVHTAVMFLSRA